MIVQVTSRLGDFVQSLIKGRYAASVKKALQNTQVDLHV